MTVLKLVDPIYTILMEFEPLRELLETLYDRYNRTEFIAPDPISVPHRFEGREDREIAGFLSATIAWGNRRAIVGNACRMMSYMDNAPADFVKNASEEELRKLTVCVHRTFNGEDLIAYVRALRSLFRRYGSLGEFFEGRYAATGSIPSVLSDFRREFFAEPHPIRSEKHLSSIDKGSACKRLNMFLRWMVRRDDRGVDFGLCRSTFIRATWHGLWDCLSGGRTTGGPSRRLPPCFARSTRRIPCVMISRCSAPVWTVF